MHLAVIGDLEYKSFFDKIIQKNNYYIVQNHDKKCVFIESGSDILDILEILKVNKIEEVLEITSEEIEQERIDLFSENNILYSGFLVLGSKNYIKNLIITALNASKKNTNLTERELEVLSLLGKGLSNKDIAKKLFLSEKTVKNHLNSIFKKIEVTDRTNAALFAIQNCI